MVRRIVLVLVLGLSVLLVPTAASAATVSAADRLTVLSHWTQPTTSSYQAWNAARLDRGPWQSYGFDWSTDYCSSSPDKPLGFDFTISCWHHDFGYRNYKVAGAFPANKPRVDDTFYSAVVRPACYSLAWTYYTAVHLFGSLASVKSADLKKAEALIR
jgi:hypothetical protein